MIGRLLLLGVILAGQSTTPGGDALKAEVHRLVRQLDAPQLAQREAAEADLLRRGPAVLDLLPPAEEGQSAEVQQRLGRVRQKLQMAAANAAVESSTITLSAHQMPLGQILQAFQEQSGNAIEAGPKTRSIAERRLDVDFRRAAFWPALDRLLDQAGVTLAPRAEPQRLAIVVAPGTGSARRIGQASYAGPFRFEPLSIVVRRDGRNPKDGILVTTVEAAWEPRLRPIYMIERMADVRAEDEHERRVPVADPEAQPEIAVDGRAAAVNLEVPLQLPSPDARRIATLKGKLWVTIPGRVETFRFDKLADAKNVRQRIAGVTVTLERIGRASSQSSGAGAAWEARIAVRFDDAGDALASHRQWIFENPAYLQTRDGKTIAYDAFETTAQDKNEVGLAYRFRTDQPLADLTFVYKTPGAIVTRAYDYELKDITLPGDR